MSTPLQVNIRFLRMNHFFFLAEGADMERRIAVGIAGTVLALAVLSVGNSPATTAIN